MFNPSARPDRKRDGNLDCPDPTFQAFGCSSMQSDGSGGLRNPKKQNHGKPLGQPSGEVCGGVLEPTGYTPAQSAFMEAERARQTAPMDFNAIARQAQKDVAAAKMDVKLFNNRAQDIDWEWRMANLSEDQLDREIELCKTYKNDSAVLGFDVRATAVTSSSTKRGMDVDD
eukprot:m.490464 g.490464  ORF g.490464 m.490464 type:complete len:171 (-) comp21777_c0_seq2:1673-2185(-)